MSETAVKICGLTREEDVVLASALGAAYLGFNFAADSPRRVTVDQAKLLAAVAGSAGSARRTGVFTDASRETIARVAEDVPLDVIQLHRRVTSEDLDALAIPVVAAVRSGGGDGDPAPEVLARCHAVLWDSSAGTGRGPDWARLEGRARPAVRLFVAGGLDADNVGDVVRRLRPAGVDVASGVERAPGIKDPGALERFFAAVREADRDAT